MEVGKLAHSHSQPGGMDRTPPGTPKKGGKMLAVRVQMLDDTVTMFQVQAKALGRVLFDQVCNQLNLLEADYFGLEYQEAGGTKYWLDLEKPLSRQIGLSLVDTLVRFCVKFYTPDPSQLEEEFTRYLFCLQIKRDLSQGLLQCNSNTAALMASYIVQAECGDYVVEDYPDHRYLSSYKFVPNQDQELERRIMENHKKHAGQSPAEADLNLLETARRCELYGIKMHPAKDHEGCPLNLAVAHMGIVVFQNYSKINTFSWAKIRKISFKRKRFLVKLHPEGYGYYKDTVEFFFEGRNECKNFWKKCVENHGFFRCTMVKKVPRQKTRVLSRGSSFRYSGRTQKQIVDFVRENYVKRQTFQRSQSFRHSSSAHSSVANVGTSISAHPLLPLGDNAVAGTPASLSCGSMTLTSSPIHTADIHAGASPSPPLTTSVSPGTSVTSSPQHFYPQETPYRRAGHRPTKVKHPPVRSHRAISPLLSPTDAATAVSNRSANHSNNDVALVCSDLISSRSSLKSPEFIDFNDVYSNCYTSLRSLGNAVESKMMDEGKKEMGIFNVACDFSNATSKSNESIRSLSKKSKPPFSGDDVDVGRYTWHRSASCKELYQQASVAIESKKEKDLMMKALETPYEMGAAPPSTRYEKSMRKCYSAVASKGPSTDRTSDAGSDARIFSGSYPGIASSLSAESPEGDLDDATGEALDVKYDSREEIALSHDDVSHDSYELLEKELYEFNDECSRVKRGRVVGDNERTRSCSWGSDRGISPLDFRSFENIVGSGFDFAREQNPWSLEREKGLRHKSEIDFRSLADKGSRSSRQATNRYDGNSYDDVEGKRRTPGFMDYDNGFGERNREIDDEIFGTRRNQAEKRIFGSKGFGEAGESGKGIYQEIKTRRTSREEKENLEEFEKKKYQNRRKSFEELAAATVSQDSTREMPGRAEERRRADKRREKREREERFHEGLKEKGQREWAKEKERRQMDRRRSAEEKEPRGEEEPARKTNDYANFQEIHFKKFERVVSNQFGKYPEFQTLENAYDFLAQEKKVMENYEKVCQVSRLAKELKKTENCASGNVFPEKRQENIRKTNRHANNFGEPPEFQEWKNSASSKAARAHVERTKSDPYNTAKNQKRNMLKHQKSIDLTPQQSEETASDYDNEEVLKKGSRSEHDIPYILHKRHCMNGTARNADVGFFKTDFKSGFGCRTSTTSESEARTFQSEADNKKPDASKELAALKQKPSCAKVAEAKKAGVQIINLDLRNGKTPVNIAESKKGTKSSKPSAAKKPAASETKPGSPKTLTKRETKNVGRSIEHGTVFHKIKKDVADVENNPKTWHESLASSEETEEPIYAEVCAEKMTAEDDDDGDGDVAENEESASRQKKSGPPDPPKRSSSFLTKPSAEGKLTKPEKRPLDKGPPAVKTASETAHGQKEILSKPSEGAGEKRMESRAQETKATDDGNGAKGGRGAGGSGSARGKQDSPLSSSVHQRREDSLTLFARTRLGLSEGSAFAPMVRQGRVGSPSSQRRTKSLDAPYVSVHSLPPADAFSSKDDTVDGNEGDIVDSAVAKFEEFCKGESKKGGLVKTGDLRPVFDPAGNTESEVDSVFTDDLEMESNFKKTVESQTKVEILGPEDRVLDGVRGKRLLSKIESVDFIDSEGDLDSSKLAEPPPIPSDRLVNLPESIRFPSVRQISGQTSEESADGWDQKEVQVKRRTPRRSVGREEQETRSKESVVWDSKDDEPPDDDVWDDNLTAVGNVGLPAEYLKRGSCGQSIDDDNLSTPMKESSPEHWVSVDDLPEALEREEKLLRQQEKILREKILNEKLKRELNLDTIDVDERYYDYRESMKQSRFEEEPTSLKENFKGHSLDTYELNEKKLRERGDAKNASLDEELLPNKLISSYGGLEINERLPPKPSSYHEGLDYIQCKVVKDVAEIDQFGDNDEELEEFFVVLDENLGKEGRHMIWDDEDAFRRTLSIDESLISVPEEFKDVEREDEELQNGVGPTAADERVDIRLSEELGKKGRATEEKRASNANEKSGHGNDVEKEESKSSAAGGGSAEEFRPIGTSREADRLSPFGESRIGSEESRKLSLSEDTGRLSPYDGSSRRSSDDPRRFSASEDADRLSPYAESRRESEDPRRLSTSEDSRKCSASESVSEETRRRLSSTEETRRKRASLTKQCSVGAESLSDEVISGIQECSSSFEHDERDVFESEPGNAKSDEIVDSRASEAKSQRRALGERSKEQTPRGREAPRGKHSQSEGVGDSSGNAVEAADFKADADPPRSETEGAVHLAPPASERELSRETEDSVDYGEGDFRDIREAVKEKDISEGFGCDAESARPRAKRVPNSSEKSESSEGEELRYIDDKRGSTPEILVGKGKEAVAMSIVVVNEGLSVLDKINDRQRGRIAEEAAKSQSLSRRAAEGAGEGKGIRCDGQRHTLPKAMSKPKPLTPKPVDYVHRKLTKLVPDIKVKAASGPAVESPNREPANLLKSSLDSSQESDLDKFSDLSLVSHVQNQIARRNLSDAGKCLRRDELVIGAGAEAGDGKTRSEEDASLENQKISSEEREKTESSSFELKSSADELVAGEDGKRNEVKGEKRRCSKSGLESKRTKREGNLSAGAKEKRSPEQEKRDSGEDGSSSSSAPPCPKRELSSTWKPFLLESSGSSSLEEGWLPPDENAHLADEEETSSTSNNQQDDSCHDDLDYPTGIGIGYPVLNGELMVSGYGSVFALSRTLSRISERSTSEQERSDPEDDITKPSSRSASVEEESILSSDRQPSLSSDPPSPKESASAIPDLPVDRPPQIGRLSSAASGDAEAICEAFGYAIPPPLPEGDWPSPPSSFGVVDAPVVSHVETFYMEIHPEEACKVVVAGGAHEEGNSSSDDNQTLQEESEFLHLSSDNMSASTTTTTQDGTVVIPVRPAAGRTGSLSEDASMISTSEWSSPTFGRPRANVEDELVSGSQDRAPPPSESSNRSNSSPSKYGAENYFGQDSQKSKIKPLKLSSPTGKTFGFFETPVSKVRSPTSQIKFFDAAERRGSTNSSLRSPTSFSETTSPKTHGRFFECHGSQMAVKAEACERRASRSPTKSRSCQYGGACTPYYSNVSDSAEKSYFGRYDTGSLERTKIQSSRKCCSYYSVSKTAPGDGDSSNSDGPPPAAPSPNTIPRASKKTRKRHRVAMDLVVRDGKIVAPPKTKTTVVENSDSDRSSPRQIRRSDSRKKQSDV